MTNVDATSTTSAAKSLVKSSELTARLPGDNAVGSSSEKTDLGAPSNPLQSDDAVKVQISNPLPSATSN